MERQETENTNSGSTESLKNPLKEHFFKPPSIESSMSEANSAQKKAYWIFDSPDDDQIPEETSEEQLSPSQKLTPSTCESKAQQVFNWTRVTEVGGRDKKLETSPTLAQYCSPIAQAQPDPLSLGVFSDVDKDFNFYGYVHKRMYKIDQDWHSRDRYFQEMVRSLGFAKVAASGTVANRPACISTCPIRTTHRSSKNSKKVIMLDLDETLVRAEPVMPGTTYAGVISVRVTPERCQSFGVHVRPFTREFLEVIGRDHKVIVYTASVQEYAEKIVAILDPDHKLIDQVLSRQHCAFVNGIFVKDLTVAINSELQLEDIIIVDNYVHSFAFHLDQGIPIKPYYGEKNDKELLHLANMLYLTPDYPRLIDFVKEHFDFSNLYRFLETNQLQLFK